MKKIRKLEILEEKVKEIQQEEDVMKVRLPTGLGNRVMELGGLEPGPDVGEVMKILEQNVIDGTVEPDNISDLHIAAVISYVQVKKW